MVMRSQVGGWEAFSAASLTPSLSQSCILRCLIWLTSRHRGSTDSWYSREEERRNVTIQQSGKDIPPFLIKKKKLIKNEEDKKEGGKKKKKR